MAGLPKALYVWLLLKQMGPRYFLFRVWFEVKRRSGILRKQFPTKLNEVKGPTRAKWQQEGTFFHDHIPTYSGIAKLADIKEACRRIESGELRYFSHEWKVIALDSWCFHPVTGYEYPLSHWTTIPDLHPEHGDIKYVWEKSRFSWIGYFLQSDVLSGSDSSSFVLKQIDSWILHNPYNLGPNWRCSQECSVRILNWALALSFYRNSQHLEEELWQRILKSIREHLHHIRQNILFSRIAVRNNHAISETMALYVMGEILFPYWKETKTWAAKAKRWLKEEICYQIREDGSYLQHSFTYQRVVVQLLNYLLYCEHNNGLESDVDIKQRATQTLLFMEALLEGPSGLMPNYGPNDGAWFFALSPTAYRNMNPSLAALNHILGLDNSAISANAEEGLETILWGGKPLPKGKRHHEGAVSFDIGGYYALRKDGLYMFLRNGTYRDRPNQADGLHLDVWFNGQNVFRDAGSYLYNVDSKTLSHFVGSAAHNTLSLAGQDHMIKGSRFIWYYWEQSLGTQINKKESELWTKARYHTAVQKPFDVQRRVKILGYGKWLVEDSVLSENQELPLLQHWHPHPEFANKLRLSSTNKEGQPLSLLLKEGYYSEFYGQKEEAPHWIVESKDGHISTTIELILK